MTAPFSDLPLKPALLTNLNTLNYTAMTEIQQKTLPLVLDGQDVIAQAKTGSGKTAAFGLGVLQALQVERFRIQSLILCPTRELADQVAQELRKLARAIHNIKILTLCGGMPFGPQIGSLAHGAHIIVGTPGRIEEHLRKGTLKLDDVQTLVFDEADRMLDMGFQEVIDTIVDQVPAQRQTLLFSATYPDEIDSLCARVTRKATLVQVESAHQADVIEQRFYRTESFDDRLQMSQRLLLNDKPMNTLIFCNTKRETDEVADFLKQAGFDALALHGDMEQRQRNETLIRFANGSVSVLVATDVAARGLDIDKLDAVINFHIAKDPEVHTHRIGRTGRAGERGRAYSFFAEKEGHKLLRMDLAQDPLGHPDTPPSAEVLNQSPFQAPMATLQIDGGKKQKVRPGDILGALTGGERPIDGKDVGKINVLDLSAYVAVRRNVASQALKKIENGKLKGRKFRVRRIRG
ncbi:ATP-dependent RNA helicase DbpA [Reinekea blandensis]|uniref:Superfamily II DNA and RNA helicase n=1 Tax=Reinekea blandensis MED297 TaxID=314283 RepID=A4B9Y1_9GAMM|nr:ATP-dependent RNA helicase DbpA [Reinekea blandensis]EAR11432.1 Superfamily II DNA and RNA helicase [Reinekea sp. MED297] [Reinekea blandensis MED297]